MLILGIDTSTNIGSVGLYSTETGLIGEMTINIKKTHSENIMVQLDNLLKITGVKIKDIDKLAVSIGPGSFTGIRIGVAAAKGIASSGNFKIAGINELDVIAGMSTENDVDICALIDARKERAYHCLYKYKDGSLERLEEYAVGELREYLESRKDKKTLYLGDGALKYKELISEIVKDNAKFAKKSLSLPRASMVAELAENKEDNLYTMEPFYLSKTQAERQKEEREKKN
ncbi:MAG: tRNA (adenosine(37)-N6)-threonylcarbamoyltransferase complex dimerization subunit type 1 TsaB [Fusobacterium sp. JB021]|nr:tRNA (adenosine(37)-N6)-threonylcarbamoyltransferase complex dimerization subunit type 1 TsaB [Fusobacterium sp. JB020]MDP0493151.1 tRNA (adenosine(37)-N6)-threonylcarbamoyltransferase complex dimerization subunit type 1 TsaB [Fusobacterium sp. JB021]MDP0507548.1 tRNA (adenosine(37)-N6)-threonylcarbamoyltransferase complex dimerization subunit type 1 TsaB [Fusobacterium sp. JB019]